MSAHYSLRARIQAGSSGHSYKEEEKRAFHASAGGGSRADTGLRRAGLEAVGPVSASRSA